MMNVFTSLQKKDDEEFARKMYLSKRMISDVFVKVQIDADVVVKVYMSFQIDDDVFVKVYGSFQMDDFVKVYRKGACRSKMCYKECI